MPKQSKSTASESAAEIDAAVRARAYHLWEADGRPDGRAEYYWYTARAEFAPAKPKRKAAAKETVPKAAAKKPGKKAMA